MISKLCQPTAGFAIVGMTVSRAAPCALPLIGGDLEARRFAS
jgi:hypothetical protein